MSKQPPPAPTASTVGPCPTAIQIVGRPGTGSLPSAIAPPDHPQVWGDICFCFKNKHLLSFSQYIKFHLVPYDTFRDSMMWSQDF